MKILITGANGFVGGYLKKELIDHGHEVVTTDLGGAVDETINLLDAEETAQKLSAIAPDAVIHLAGQSSVALSWKKPKLTLEINVNTTLNLLDAIAEAKKTMRMLVIGSADQYGLIDPKDYVVKETTPVNPQSPYAISKCTQERLALSIAKARSLDVLTTRSFNHIGPYQKPGFVVPDFCKGIAEIEKGAHPVMNVGNLDVFRDFTDVRDVAAAYRLLVEKGKSNEVYNVGSGALISISEILDTLISFSSVKIEREIDPAKLRPVELVRLCCDNTKLKNDTGWEQQYDIKQSLENTLQWWRTQV